MADGVARRFGRIDLLVNTAGINLRRAAEVASEEDWLKVLDVNLVGAFRVAQAIGRHLIAGGGGKIVTLSSTRGILGFPGGYSAYCASKAGLDMLTRQLATEWARHNVNVNAVAPIYVDTPLIAALKDDPQLYPTLVGRIPLGRFGRPADLVGAVLFLVSPASDFVTGQILYVDGGISATEFYAPAPVKRRDRFGSRRPRNAAKARKGRRSGAGVGRKSRTVRARKERGQPRGDRPDQG